MARDTNTLEDEQSKEEIVSSGSTGRRGFLSTITGLGVAASLPLGAGDASAAPISEGPVQSSYSLQSPDGAVTVDIKISDGSASYSLAFDGQTLLDSSNLGIELGDGTLDGNLAVTGSRTVTHDETWSPVWGGFSEIRNHCNQLEIGLETTDSPRRVLTLEFRAFDDGVGFRYVFPDQENLGDFSITSENTGFEFAGDYESWWIPNDWDNYEYFYFNTPISEVHAGDQQNHDKTSDPLPENNSEVKKDGTNTPLTMKAADDCYLSIHEAALTDYAGMTLTQVSQGTTSFESSLVPRPSGDKVWATTPHASPWRTVQLGRSPGDLVESRLLLNLNEPCKIDDTSWIEPQKYCGVWWELHIGKSKWPNGEDDGVSIGARTENVKRYMDFASEHGIGTVVAEGWNKSYDSDMIYTDSGEHFDHRDAWDYGQSLNPSVSFMAHNETVGYVDRYERQLDDAYSWYGEEVAVNSIKSGYVDEDNVNLHDQTHHHHDQEMVKHYRRSITTAAENELMLNAHEPIKPTGVRRTYPNFMTREGAAGLEYQNFSADGIPPSHTVTTPFTRMLAGPIDHCPGIFDVFYDEYEGGLQADPDCRVQTTRARQLAHYPMILSGLQMVADLVEYYVDGDDLSDVPPEFQFIKDVPVDWDETTVPTASIGEYTAIARRSGTDWWVGVATDENPRTVDVPLEFLDSETTYTATIYADGPDCDFATNPHDVERSRYLVDETTTIKSEMVKGGGQAIRIEPATSDETDSLQWYSGDDITDTVTYQLKAKHSGKYLDVEGGSTDDGATVHQWSDEGQTSAHWIVDELSDERYRLRNENSGKYLDVEGGSIDDGADVHQWSEADVDYQKWEIEHISDDEYRVVNSHSAKVLAVENASVSDGANVHQSEWDDTENQRWVFERV
ncbi:glycoside hydrolase family 97 catalytic domain-containing protein [Natrinema versiforme]|nr:glycoside hydrolase family 97 catalytic domain-containing protein [Natrinema versiforme]